MSIENRIIGCLLIALAACGPDRGFDGQSGGTTGAGTTVADSGASSTTGVHACGVDGIAVGPIVLRSDADVDALAGCNVVDGDLYIDPCRVCLEDADPCSQCPEIDTLTSLLGLQSLQRVDGSLVMGWAGNPSRAPCTGPTALTTLEGLENLREVEGSLELDCAPEVVEARLSSLERVGTPTEGQLRVSTGFPVVIELPNLREVGSFRLLGPSKTRIGAPKLERVWGDLQPWETRIPELGELQALSEVHGEFRAYGDTELADLSPVDELTLLGGLTIGDLPNLTRIELPSLSGAMDRGLVVGGSSPVERIVVAPTVTSIIEIDLAANPKMSVFEAVGVQDIRWLRISGNASLSSLDGLQSLETMGETALIGENPSLCTSEVEAFIAGLEIGDHDSIYDNGDC